MDWLYEVSFYLNNILLIAAFGFALAWPRRRAKVLLALFIGFFVLGSVVFYVTGKLWQHDILPYGSFTSHFLRVTGSLLHITATATVVCFVLAGLRGRAPQAGLAGQRWGKPALSTEERRSILSRREWTYVLDNILVNAICFLLGIGVALAAGPYGDEVVIGVAWICGGALGILYFLFKDSVRGRSLAKAMTGLQVVDAGTGEPIGPGQSFVRNWIFLVPFFPLVELIVANVRQDKRRLGDLMANTVVIRAKRHDIRSPQARMPDTLSDKPPMRSTNPTPLKPDSEFIRFYCDCGQRIKVLRKDAGKKGQCPKCQKPIQVPDV